MFIKQKVYHENLKIPTVLPCLMLFLNPDLEQTKLNKLFNEFQIFI